MSSNDYKIKHRPVAMSPIQAQALMNYAPPNDMQTLYNNQALAMAPVLSSGMDNYAAGVATPQSIFLGAILKARFGDEEMKPLAQPSVQLTPEELMSLKTIRG